MMRSLSKDKKIKITLKSTLTTKKHNLEKLLKYQKSMPVEQELKISIIDPLLSPNLINSTPNSIKNVKSRENDMIAQGIRSVKQKPSEKFKVCLSDPFNTEKKNKTNFGYIYSAGGIPCRILHGNSKLKLKWDIEPSSIAFTY